MDEENEFHEQFDALFRTKNELNDFDFDSYDSRISVNQNRLTFYHHGVSVFCGALWFNN